jgi:hypothetical protein
MPQRVFLFCIGWCMAVVSWQTFAYPPTFLTGAWVWASVAALASATSTLAALTSHRGFAVFAGAALICHSVGRAGTIAIGMAFPDHFEFGAPFANYAVAAATWALVAVLSMQAWSHYVLPWTAARKAS